MSIPTKIVIIGGGASGTIAAIHLFHQFKTPVKIYLLEKRQEALFRGAAYSSKLGYEPLNVPAGKMSIFSHLPDDFYNWLLANRAKEQDGPVSRESFVSRRWFGDYLTERLSAAKSKAPNADFQVIISEVRDIEQQIATGKYKVKLAEGGLPDADYLIFATGNEAPAELLNNFEKALLGKKYLSKPWSGELADEIKPNDNVLILGSGLSMVDYAVSLYKKQHKGKIYAFSRNGYLPLLQLAGKNGSVDFDTDASEISNVLRALRQSVSNGEEEGIEWQSIVNSIRDETPLIWKQLSLSSKKKFLQRLKPFWEIHRHRMPEESCDALDEMVLRNQFQVLSGKRLGISTQNGKLVFRFISKKERQENSVPVNYVINCTSPAGDYYESGNWLVKSLLKKGWMRQDELKLGIVTGNHGEIVTAEMEALANAYAIGPLRKATEWESTAVREIKNQAEELALEIYQSVVRPELVARFCDNGATSTFTLQKRA